MTNEQVLKLVGLIAEKHVEDALRYLVTHTEAIQMYSKKKALIDEHVAAREDNVSYLQMMAIRELISCRDCRIPYAYAALLRICNSLS